MSPYKTSSVPALVLWPSRLFTSSFFKQGDVFFLPRVFSSTYPSREYFFFFNVSDLWKARIYYVVSRGQIFRDVTYYCADGRWKLQIYFDRILFYLEVLAYFTRPRTNNHNSHGILNGFLKMIWAIPFKIYYLVWKKNWHMRTLFIKQTVYIPTVSKWNAILIDIKWHHPSKQYFLLSSLFLFACKRVVCSEKKMRFPALVRDTKALTICSIHTLRKRYSARMKIRRVPRERETEKKQTVVQKGLGETIWFSRSMQYTRTIRNHIFTLYSGSSARQERAYVCSERKNTFCKLITLWKIENHLFIYYIYNTLTWTTLHSLWCVYFFFLFTADKVSFFLIAERFSHFTWDVTSISRKIYFLHLLVKIKFL